MPTLLRSLASKSLSNIHRGLLCTVFLFIAPTSISAQETTTAMPFDQLQWAPVGDTPVQIAWQWGGPQSDDHAYFIKLPAGFTTGPHTHTGGYHGVNLTGTWVHTFGEDDVMTLPPGSYIQQPGGEVHNDMCEGSVDCILYVHQHAPFDFIPAGEHAQ